jgi:hypothetical protein
VAAAQQIFLLQQNSEFGFSEFWRAENFLARPFFQNGNLEFCCSRFFLLQPAANSYTSQTRKEMDSPNPFCANR